MSKHVDDASPKLAHFKHYRTTRRLKQAGSYTVTLDLEQLTACLVSLHAMQTMINGRPHERLAVVGLHLDAQQFLSIPACKLYIDDVRDSEPIYGPLIDKLWELIPVEEWEAL